MKKFIVLVIALVILLTASCALAEANIASKDYTDVPGMPTQESVCFIQLLPDHRAQTKDADERSINLLNDIYSFVYDEGNRPVRYYDENTQYDIEQLIGGTDPNVLHMSEYMTVELSAEPDAAQEADGFLFDMMIDVKYEPGQLVVAVIGDSDDANEETRWHPYLCEVTETGRINLVIPEEDMELFRDQSLLFNVLTDRPDTPRETIWSQEEINERIVRPSKTAEELRRVLSFAAVGSEPVQQDFRLFTAALTEDMNSELDRISSFIDDAGSVYSYFPAQSQNEIRLIASADTDVSKLIVSDVIAVGDENYHDTYGDVAAQMTFAANYSMDQDVIVMVGFPSQDSASWDWYCMRAVVFGSNVETTFEQNVLIRMAQQQGMLMVLTEPLSEEA